MTHQEALNIIYQAARLAQMSDYDHEKVRQAVKLLAELLEKQEKPKKA